MTSIKPIVPDMRYHANDWNIVSKKEKEFERVSGLQFLSSNSFQGRCVEWQMFNKEELLEKQSEINSIINNRWFFVIITGKNIKRKIIVINHLNELLATIQNNPKFSSNNLTLTFINMIQKTNGCCSGTVLSDGKRDIKIELMNNSVNTRDITDGSKDPKSMLFLETELVSLKIVNGLNNSYALSQEYKFVVHEIIRCCRKVSGYFEFIYGTNQKFGFPNLYFTYFSENPRYGFLNTKWKD